MDAWTLLVGGLISVGTFAIGAAKDLLSHRLERSGKALERQALEEDRHRSELKAAYGEFAHAFVSYLRAASRLSRADFRNHRARDAAEQKERDAKLTATWQAADEERRLAAIDYNESSKQMHLKAVAVLLLEQDEHLSKHVDKLLTTRIDPVLIIDLDELAEHDTLVRELGEAFHELTLRLGGRFAPGYEKRTSTALPPAPSQKALESAAPPAKDSSR
jgi:hypothetical protein